MRDPEAVSGSGPDASRPRADEVAVTSGVASTFGLHLGSTWRDLGGTPLRVVGIVQDPKAYDDQFAVVAPGRLPSTNDVTVQIDADLSNAQLQSFHLPSGTPGQILGVAGTTRTQVAVAVLVLATLTLLFVGLVSVASFSVLAHRRQRALGMLGSVGATDRHIRLVMLANGAAVGVVATVVGTAVGLVGWLLFSPAVAQLVVSRRGSIRHPVVGGVMAAAPGRGHGRAGRVVAGEGGVAGPGRHRALRPPAAAAAGPAASPPSA